MAASAVSVLTNRPTLSIMDIIFPVQGDVTLVITAAEHGLTGVPLLYVLCPLLEEFYLNSLHISNVSAAGVVTITGANVVNSENADPQARLTLMSPHSIL